MYFYQIYSMSVNVRHRYGVSGPGKAVKKSLLSLCKFFLIINWRFAQSCACDSTRRDCLTFLLSRVDRAFVVIYKAFLLMPRCTHLATVNTGLSLLIELQMKTDLYQSISHYLLGKTYKDFSIQFTMSGHDRWSGNYQIRVYKYSIWYKKFITNSNGWNRIH